MKHRYNLGDKVWYAERESVEESVTCPECFGKRYLTVILGDDSKVTIDCVGCSPGLGEPRGYVTYRKQEISVRLVTIDGFEVTSHSVEYKFDMVGCGYRIAKDTEVFATKEEAEIKAKELAKEYNKEELAKINRKDKNHRSWSWHVHYHRSCIREAEKALVFHKAKLEVAITKAEGEKK